MCCQMCAAIYSDRKEEECSSSSPVDGKMYTSGNIANLHRVPNEIIKNGAIVKVRTLMKQFIL